MRGDGEIMAERAVGVKWGPLTQLVKYKDTDAE